ncbi:biotin--[acetyl-CoA-carboxylase] ligase [Microbacterium telephonicum]|uniref:biotin--[biotin carboxyl-carrier protein] ligase n=1 Tax=Microbacterium telephonicum TaxID=1714841 RepID=A0A498BVK0_9MICO|nr:biotin--[acetyl-CoA-carboxylase] ligase [Microbacterium telephonicum]RLK47774.1 BirA family biotin operon repressor/biotin-[acetyl-CoA-carboxylase] ligase [Microbacterium telephonicum]
MTFPPLGYPLAAAVSPRLHLIDSVESTNAKLLRDVQDDPAGHPHLAALVTTDQTAGRGRLDRTWVTPPGSALAVSVVLLVEAVADADRGWIPLVAGAAMAKAVGAQLDDVSLKWPNDVLVGGGPTATNPAAKKICGILAEVVPGHPHAVVVGAGVNTAMTADQLPVATATSFAVLGREADADRLLADYLTALRDLVAELAVGGGEAVRGDVEAVCGTIGSAVTVSLPDGTTRAGTAVRLDPAGRLVIAREGVESVVSAGDIVHAR